MAVFHPRYSVLISCVVSFTLGFADVCFDHNKGVNKKGSIMLDLDEEAFKEKLVEWFPKLSGKSFAFYKSSARHDGTLELLTIRTPMDILSTNWTGITIIQNTYRDIATSSTSTSTSTTSEAVTDPLVTENSDPDRPDAEIDTPPPLILPDSTLPPLYLPVSPVPDQSEEVDVEYILQVNRMDKMLDRQEISIARDKVLVDGLTFYDDDSILNCELYVDFRGEEGEDMNGLTREFFSLFWDQFLNRFGDGENLRYITVSPFDSPPAVVFRAAGRVLLHGFILHGYLPIGINPSTLYRVLFNAEPKDESVLRSFIDTFRPGDAQFLSDAMKREQLTENDVSRLYVTLHRFVPYFTAIPNTGESLKTVLVNLARHVLLKASFFAIGHMHVPNEVVTKLNESSFIKYIDSLKPTGEEISKRLEVRYSNDGTSYGLVGVVIGYLRQYLDSMNSDETKEFLTFVTGAEILPKRLGVEFNGNTNGELMLPVGHLCSREIELSRYIPSYTVLSKNIATAVQDESVRRFALV